jgi:Tfp pilus assembly protein FimT
MNKKLRLLLVVPVLFLVAVLAVAGLQLRTGSSADRTAGSVASDDPGSSELARSRAVASGAPTRPPPDRTQDRSRSRRSPHR